MTTVTCQGAAHHFDTPQRAKRRTNARQAVEHFPIKNEEINLNTKDALPQEAPAPDILTNFLFGTVDDPLLKLPILRAGLELQVWAKSAAGHQAAAEMALLAERRAAAFAVCWAL